MMTKSNGKYRETSLEHYSGNGFDFSKVFIRNKPSSFAGQGSVSLTESRSLVMTEQRAQLRQNGSNLPSTWKRPQFVSILGDDSGSMRFDGKCQALTEGVREMIYEMQLRSHDGVSAFDVAILPFGDFVFLDERTLGRPVLDINPDDIVFDGSSGQTKIKSAMHVLEELLAAYERNFLRNETLPQNYPPPLCCLLSDGYNGDGNPTTVADRIKRMRLSNGKSPMIVTCGIEYGRDEPDVALLQKIASIDEETGRPLYFDIADLDCLINFFASALSSGSVSPSQFLQAAITVNPEWR